MVRGWASRDPREGKLLGLSYRTTDMANEASDESVPPPDYLVPAIRCGLEMALVGTIVALLGLPAESTLMTGFVLLVALMAMLVVLFYSLNQQVAEWIRRAQKRPTIHDEGGLL